MKAKSEFDELVLLKVLHGIEGIGNVKIINLRDKFGSLQNVFSSDFSSLIEVDGINEILAKRIKLGINNFSKYKLIVESEFEQVHKKGFNILPFWDVKYSKNLINIYAPPTLLYYYGNIELINSDCIAVVGTRNPTKYGIENTKIFTENLVANNFTIVSGMARGIDSISHETCLKYSGNTIAVVGSGLDWIYPPENKELFKRIGKNGLVVSEYPLGTKPDGKNFPERNRIISGLSEAVLVIETKISGGAFLTARIANDQNREVYAIPGNINSPQSEGNNFLIKSNLAKLVQSSDDILTDFNKISKTEFSVKPPKDLTSLSLFEQKIYEVLSENPIHIDQIAEKTNFTVVECSVHLLTLEMKNFVTQLPGKYFTIS